MGSRAYRAPASAVGVHRNLGSPGIASMMVGPVPRLVGGFVVVSQRPEAGPASANFPAEG